MGRAQQARQLARLLGKQLDAFASEVRSISTATPGRGALAASSAEASAAREQGKQLVQTRGSAMAATATAAPTATIPHARVVVPAVHTDIFGAVSMVSASEKVEEGVYKNVDGHRFEDGRYAKFIEEITAFIPKERQYSDPVRTFAYGTDASFYRLNPKLVVKVRGGRGRGAGREVDGGARAGSRATGGWRGTHGLRGPGFRGFGELAVSKSSALLLLCTCEL